MDQLPPHRRAPAHPFASLRGYPVARFFGLNFENRPPAVILAISLVLIVIIGAIDVWLSAQDISFLVFYLLPIFLVSWFIGWRWGLACAMVCGASNFLIDFAHVSRAVNPAAPFISGLTGLLVYAVTARVISVLRALMEHERETARTDDTTGAANRRALYEAMAVELYRTRRNNQPISLVVIDLDNFKAVNDKSGHHEGDRLLALTVKTMQRETRITDVVARLGGDEFAILLPETDAESAYRVVARLQNSLRTCMAERKWPVTFSIGLATFTAPPATADELLSLADRLMYTAKREGKNTIRQQTI